MKRRDSLSAILPRRRHSRLVDIKSSESETLLGNSRNSDKTKLGKVKQTLHVLTNSWQNGAEIDQSIPVAHRTASTPRLFYGKMDSIQENKRTKTHLKYNTLRSLSTTAFHQSFPNWTYSKETARRSNELLRTTSCASLKQKSSSRIRYVAENKVCFVKV